MKNLALNSTKNTPEVLGDVKNGTLSLSGNSFPENSRSYYDAICNWLHEYYKSYSNITFICDFNYLSSSSLISVLNLLRKAENSLGKDNCKLIWKFEDDDDDIRKIGEDFSKIISFEVDLVSY